MKVLFISQPMNGKSDEEILKEREQAIAKVKEVVGEDVEVLETFFDDFSVDAKPLEYLARSIEFLAKADIAYFAPGWETARGCKIEHDCARAYGIDILYCTPPKMSFGQAFDMLRLDMCRGIKLPHWKEDAVVKIQWPLPDDTSEMTAPYLYVESRHGRVPWEETKVELFSDKWEIVEWA